MAPYVPPELTEALEGAAADERIEVVVVAAEGATEDVESTLVTDPDTAISDSLSRGVFIIEGSASGIRALGADDQVASLSMPDRAEVML